ncbi:MAG: glycine betaine ABC transporter substrate-binding protein [Lachnospiraceae bacterium]
MKKRSILTIMLSVVLIFTAVGCGSSEKNDTITIYDGQFAEMQLIHRMVKLLVEDQTDLTVEILDEMAPVNLFNELVDGNSDLMNSYDGTLLTTYLGQDSSDVPDDMTLYDYANEQASEEYSVHLLGKLGLNNTYAIGVPQSVADEYKLETISDLAKVADQLVFGAEHDFFTEEGSAKFNPFSEFYGLNFKEAKQIDMTLKYSAVQSGTIDVVVVYATDGLNRQAELKVLEDDQHYFPEYNGALLVRDDFFEKYNDAAPNLDEVIDQLTGLFTDEIMTELSYQVDVEARTADEVAEEFLTGQGLLN